MAWDDISRLRVLQEDATDRAVSGFPVSITSDHYNVHQSQAYSFTAYSSIANDGTYCVSMVTPATGKAHLRVTDLWTSQSEAWLEIVESPTSFTAGTTLTPVPRNRVVATATDLTLTTGCTFTAGAGTTVEFIVAGGGGTASGRSGGASRPIDAELYLKAGTTYIFQLTNKGGAAAHLALWVFYYKY